MTHSGDRRLGLQAPVPVNTGMLGCNDDHTIRIAEEAGGTWRHYAAGDHRPSGAA
ncbi:hypothetical protein OG909_31275 [Streptomyces sp. NBC_01754]|uniref:hypothetical protein n=1 Tax=Streptomyces sp. NBC_01754 TaxID=2975930 RepID=UPI002DD9B20B|nr:hypothetical protein [Streptomyces sp. NBC_01754]WSC96429.1 hypothetical protein OG909_31275 [Streptomyces sp. NBC_01754]